MRPTTRLMVISVCLITIISCSTFVLQPTATVTVTSLPTVTSTPKPTTTPTNTSTVTALPPTVTPSKEALHIPTGIPVSTWNDIPIMSNAVSGDGDDKGYSYTVDATLDYVQIYYNKALAKLGWSLIGTGQGKGKSILLFYQKGSETLTILAVADVDELTLVMLVKV